MILNKKKGVLFLLILFVLILNLNVSTVALSNGETCTTDSSCNSGICDERKIGQGTSIIPGTCQPCTSDSCPSGYSCEDNRECYLNVNTNLNGNCRIDSGCSGGQVCRNRVCVDQTISCALDRDSCPQGFRCFSNNCIRINNPPQQTECEINEDCLNGECIGEIRLLGVTLRKGTCQAIESDTNNIPQSTCPPVCPNDIVPNQLSFSITSNCPEGRRIMKLSDSNPLEPTYLTPTNMHGEIYNYQNSVYNNYLCAPISGTNVCNNNPSSSNLVLKLSDITNAHAEAPGDNTYQNPQKVCYGDLQCVTATNRECNLALPESKCVIKLSDTTNAHLEDCKGTNYPISVCCKSRSGAIPPDDRTTPPGDECRNNDDCTILGEGCKDGNCRPSLCHTHLQGREETYPVLIKSPRNENLRPLIEDLQIDLLQLDIALIPNTEYGTFGELTEQAIMNFQTQNSINPSGIVDMQTWEKLEEKLCEGEPISCTRNTDCPDGQNCDTTTRTCNDISTPPPPTSCTSGSTRNNPSCMTLTQTCINNQWVGSCPTIDIDDPTTDIDGDGIPDDIDNCVGQSNTDQSDTDDNGVGDVCDEGADCNENNDCASGDCNDDECTEPVDCNSNSECPSGFYCVSSQCVQSLPGGGDSFGGGVTCSQIGGVTCSQQTQQTQRCSDDSRDATNRFSEIRENGCCLRTCTNDNECSPDGDCFNDYCIVEEGYTRLSAPKCQLSTFNSALGVNIKTERSACSDSDGDGEGTSSVTISKAVSGNFVKEDCQNLGLETNNFKSGKCIYEEDCTVLPKNEQGQAIPFYSIGSLFLTLTLLFLYYIIPIKKYTKLKK